MLGNIIAGLGSKIGGYLGGGILSTLGKYAGRMAGSYLEKKWFSRTKTSHKFVNLRDSFHIVKAEYGKPIPLLWGKMRLPGQIIWANKIASNANNFQIKKYFRANLTINEQNISEMEYFASFAMAICEGEILEIGRVWHHDEIIDLSQYKHRLYTGSEEQMPDPLIAASHQGPSPAYRGLAYIVFEKLPLAEFDHTIPNFSFEVTRKANLEQQISVEDMVQAMTIIPGSGEYVYDTNIQYKQIKEATGSKEAINSHNHQDIADSVYSLNQMQSICENVKWVAPVVCWFGDNIDAGQCLIRPAVEFKDDQVEYSEEWQVAGYDRETAYEISKDEKNNPQYGGSVSDQSVLRYLAELRSRKLKIMFYPMFFLDVDQKPWRGRVTGTAESIRRFFNRQEGYNEFILHYANLVKNHVDAFLIGSELIGLTRVSSNGSYPAVEELVKLAAQVKKIMGPSVKVSYAADWSEYHHTEGGWFNLDPLWSSPHIDFVGIDAYFPVTDSISSIIDPQKLDQGWSSGEGFDYYIDHSSGEKHDLQPEHAWKNIRYWWENHHINPDGRQTGWRPKSKPIWFTEYGFPSIDKGPNQPNVFFDPKCLDGGVPKFSNGNIDFTIQRKAIASFIKYWQQEEYIGEMFLWTWDARPYPAWPHMNIWSDGYLWEKGHWVNDKFGNSNLASILAEIAAKSSIQYSNIDVSSIDLPVKGFVLSNAISAINAINILRVAYFFDINSCREDRLTFVRRGFKQNININENDCVKLSDHSFLEQTAIPDSMKLSQIHLYHIDHFENYQKTYHNFNNDQNSYANASLVRLPIALEQREAENIGKLILANAQIENTILKFSLTTIEQQIRPGDFIKLASDNVVYIVRVIALTCQELQQEITAIIDQQNIYCSDHTTEKEPLKTSTGFSINHQLLVDIISSESISDAANIVVNYIGNSVKPLYTRFMSESAWQKLIDIMPSQYAPFIDRFEQPQAPNIFMVDETSKIYLSRRNLNISSHHKWQQAKIGQEYIAFKHVEQRDDQYVISHLIRGLRNTEDYMQKHKRNEDFTLIKEQNILSVSRDLLHQILEFRCGKINLFSKISPPKKESNIYISKQQISGNQLHLAWIYRSTKHDYWQIPFDPSKISYHIQIKELGRNAFETQTHENFLIIEEFSISGPYEIHIIASIN